MDNKKVVSPVDEFDFWEEEILRKIQMEEQMKATEAKSNSVTSANNEQTTTP